MELEEHITKLKIALQAFAGLEWLTQEQTLACAQAVHREWALDQRTEYIAASRGKGAAASEQEKSSWRDERATEKQIAILKRANIPHLADIKKGEASDLIEQIMSRR